MPNIVVERGTPETAGPFGKNGDILLFSECASKITSRERYQHLPTTHPQGSENDLDYHRT